jgi:hypothetical protein
MLSRKQILAAMAGLAMMAVPISALAKHHDDFNNQRPQAWHDRGFHNGEAKRQFVPAMPARLAHPYIAEPRVLRDSRRSLRGSRRASMAAHTISAPVIGPRRGESAGMMTTTAGVAVATTIAGTTMRTTVSDATPTAMTAIGSKVGAHGTGRTTAATTTAHLTLGMRPSRRQVTV